MIFAIIIGFSAGTFAAFHVSRWIVAALSDRLARSDEQRRYMRSVAIVFGGIALAPAIFLTVMAGAVANARRGSTTLDVLGLGEAGLPVALALGLVIVVTLIVATAAAGGALFGYLVLRR